MLLPLVCPCLQENMRRNLLCKDIVCNFYKINCAKPFLFLKNIPEGPTIKNIQSRSKFSISIEIFNLARTFQSRRLDFPTKNRAAVGGLLENVILARNFQSRSKSRIFLIFGPSGMFVIILAAMVVRIDRDPQLIN